MSDSTLILRGRPADRTPGWVGEAGRADGGPAQTPPWQAPAEAVPPPVDGDDTLVRVGALRREPRPRLLAHERDLPAALRRDAAWSDHFERVRRAPLAEARALEDALAATPPCDAEAVAALVDRALGRPGAFRAPIAVVAGDLVLELDEVARLRATVPLLLPRAATHPDAAMAVSEARALLASGNVDASAAIVAMEALWHTHGGDPADQARMQRGVERGLLARRAIVKASAQGRELFRGALHLEGSGALLDAFASPSLLETVALVPRLRCRAFVALGAAAGGPEPQPVFAQVLALAARIG